MEVSKPKNFNIQNFDLSWSSNVISVFQALWTVPIVTRPHYFQVSFSHSPVLKITLSSSKLCLSITEVDCLCVLWNKTLLQSRYSTLPQSIQPNFTHDDTEYILHTTNTKKLIKFDLQNYLLLHAIKFSNNSLTTAVTLICLSEKCTKDYSNKLPWQPTKQGRKQQTHFYI